MNPRGTSPRTAIGSFPLEVVIIIQEINVSATATNAFLITEMKKKVWATSEGVSEGENETVAGTPNRVAGTSSSERGKSNERDTGKLTLISLGRHQSAPYVYFARYSKKFRMMNPLRF